MDAPPPPSLAPLALLLAPAGLVGVFLVARRYPGLRPGPTRRAAGLAAVLALFGAGLGAVLLALHGASTSPTLGVDGLGLSLRLDLLSVTMTLLVAVLAAVLLPFSRTYLDGDPRQGRFLGDFALTLALVLLFVASGNVVLLVATWVATSLVLHRLLAFRTERPRAMHAARRKFLVARGSDLALAAAAVLLVRAYGTGDVASILHGAASSPVATPGAGAAAVLLALAAVLKSVQFPAHVWLPETIETPTPVSALLHAGIVNAGGFLIVRFADVVLAAPVALALLVLFGGTTMLFASLVMTTQTTVKARLAWSTIAQMGLMIFQCGLGAFAIAVLHIVAHSLYKAHAFLRSGSVVNSHAKAAADRAPASRRPAPFLAAVALASLLLAGFSAATGVSLRDKPGALLLAGVLLLGVAPLLARALEAGRRALVVPALLLTSTVVLLYLGAAALFTSLFGGVVPSVAPNPLAVLVLTGLFLLSLLQWLAPRLSGSARWARWKVHLRSGLYVTDAFDRLRSAARRSVPVIASRGAAR